jgi:hypothetical protein
MFAKSAHALTPASASKNQVIALARVMLQTANSHHRADASAPASAPIHQRTFAAGIERP